MIIDFGFLPSLLVFIAIVGLLGVGIKITSDKSKGGKKGDDSSTDRS